jgi:hypothetical protein
MSKISYMKFIKIIVKLSSLLILGYFVLAYSTVICATASSSARELKNLQCRLQTLKMQYNRLNSEINTKLTKAEQKELNDSLQASTRELKYHLDKIQSFVKKNKLADDWVSLPPELKLDRAVALAQACVDYVIMLAMQMQQAEGAKDKDAIASVLDMLQKFEEALQKMKNSKIDEYLETKMREKEMLAATMQAMSAFYNKYEVHVDRPGMDYRNFLISDGNIATCENACNKDNRCKAWTFQWKQKRCWLKYGVPPKKSDDYCISGTKKVLEKKET